MRAGILHNKKAALVKKAAFLLYKVCFYFSSIKFMSLVNVSSRK